MKLLFVFVVLAGVLCRAASPEAVILAAMKLSEQPNYSWSTTVTDDARTYDVEGKTLAGQLTWVRLPMVKSIAQRLGRDADTQIEAVFRGREAVLRTERGWQTVKELPKRHPDWREGTDYWPPVSIPMPLPGQSSVWGRGGLAPDPLDPFPIILHSPPPWEEEEKRPYSNAQFAVSHPHEELAIIVSSYGEMRTDGDTVVGTLSELGAQLLLVRDGQDHISVGNAGGLFRLHLKNGIVTKYTLQLEGILWVDRRKVHVHQLSTTTVSNVGSTALSVPDEARRKLGL